MQMSVIQEVSVYNLLSDEEIKKGSDITHIAFNSIFGTWGKEDKAHIMKILDRKMNELCMLLMANPEVATTKIVPGRNNISIRVNFHNGEQRHIGVDLADPRLQTEGASSSGVLWIMLILGGMLFVGIIVRFGGRRTKGR